MHLHATYVNKNRHQHPKTKKNLHMVATHNYFHLIPRKQCFAIVRITAANMRPYKNVYSLPIQSKMHRRYIAELLYSESWTEL